jgi:hypothetical protein
MLSQQVSDRRTTFFGGLFGFALLFLSRHMAVSWGGEATQLRLAIEEAMDALYVARDGVVPQRAAYDQNLPPEVELLPAKPPHPVQVVLAKRLP